MGGRVGVRGVYSGGVRGNIRWLIKKNRGSQMGWFH